MGPWRRKRRRWCPRSPPGAPRRAKGRRQVRVCGPWRRGSTVYSFCFIFPNFLLFSSSRIDWFSGFRAGNGCHDAGVVVDGKTNGVSTVPVLSPKSRNIRIKNRIPCSDCRRLKGLPHLYGTSIILLGIPAPVFGWTYLPPIVGLPPDSPK